MKEVEFIKWWKNLAGEKIFLKNLNGKEVSLLIIYPGEFSSNNGPDFQNACIKLNNKLLKGDVEFHLKAVDWFKHNHHLDPEYNNVVLHIVKNPDTKLRIVNSKDKRVNTLILPENININKKGSRHRFPCFYLINRKKNRKRFLLLLKLLGLKRISIKVERVKHQFFLLKNFEVSFMHKFNILFWFNFIIYLFYPQIFFDIIKQIMKKYYGLPILFTDLLLKTIPKNRRAITTPWNQKKKRLNQTLSLLDSEIDFDSIYKILLRSDTWQKFVNDFQKLFSHSSFKPGKFKLQLALYNTVIPLSLYFSQLIKDEDVEKQIYSFIFDVPGIEFNKKLKIQGKILNLKSNSKMFRFNEISLQGIIMLYDSWCKYKECELCPLYKIL